jgi:hypothetical protein
VTALLVAYPLVPKPYRDTLLYPWHGGRTVLESVHSGNVADYVAWLVLGTGFAGAYLLWAS